MAEPVPVMMDGSTFVVHGETRSFWVKLWHAGGDLARIERAQVISCLPSTRGMQVIVGGLDEEDFDEEDFDDDDDDFDELDASDEASLDEETSSAGVDSSIEEEGGTQARDS